MNRPVCIDASVVLKLVVVEADSEQAVGLWTALAERGHHAVAPALLLFECVSSIRRLVYQQRMRAGAARLALDRLLTLPIAFPTPDGLVDRAWQLAARYRQPQAYDSFYLALADLMNVSFWTADQRLYNALKGELDWVRLLGHDPVDRA
jgi:predicted nucleic acid-binding protein